jgi:acetyl esterase/lipase
VLRRDDLTQHYHTKLVSEIAVLIKFDKIIMAPRDDTTPETRFDSYTIFRTSYKEVNNQGIDVAVFIPKNLKPGKHPILAKFHGGGLVRCIPYILHSLACSRAHTF